MSNQPLPYGGEREGAEVIGRSDWQSNNLNISNMNKKVLIPLVVVGVLLLGGIAYLTMSLQKEKQANKAM